MVAVGGLVEDLMVAAGCDIFRFLRISARCANPKGNGVDAAFRIRIGAYGAVDQSGSGSPSVRDSRICCRKRGLRSCRPCEAPCHSAVREHRC